jgi:hypothetical protein
MTMHTGQHLISALADTKFSLPTLSWSMPPYPSTEPCYVELPRGLTRDEAAEIETIANDLVMNRGQRDVGDEEGIKVWIENRLQGTEGTEGTGTPVVAGGGDDDEDNSSSAQVVEWGDRESRGLPKDYEDGVIRTAVIDGVDRSCEFCCACGVRCACGWGLSLAHGTFFSNVDSMLRYSVSPIHFVYIHPGPTTPFFG